MLASRLGSKHIGMALLTVLMLSLVPISITNAQGSEQKKAEKFVELAERASEKVGNFIDLIYANETAIQTITDTGLYYDGLEGNKTLFETWGLGNLTEAKVALESDDYPGAIANATEALSIFREVFKALNAILADSGVQRGKLVDAQGLIEAMKRALERIERLREIAPVEILPLLEPILESAEKYLDLTEARRWLLQGRVNETAWNKTQANKLISLAHSLLKKKTAELNVKRIESYLGVIDKFYDRLGRLVEKAGAEELKEKLETVKLLIEGAKSDLKTTPPNIAGAISKLVDARNMLKEIERDLLELRRG